MGIINTFIEQASNIWWGIVAAFVVTGVLYLIIYMLQGGSKSFTPLSALFAVPLLPLLAFQFYLLFGAVGVKHKCSEIAVWVDAFLPEQTMNDYYSTEDLQKDFREVVATFPFVAKIIDIDDISTNKDYTFGEALTHKINSYLNWYIVRRVAWSVGFIVLAAVGFLLTTRRTNNYDLENLDTLDDISDLENLENIGII